MDTLAHALYGATLFSQTGLAGGACGPVDADGRPKPLDWTFWAACAFGALPDMVSIGIFFLASIFMHEPFSFATIPRYVFVLYKWTHSLVVAAAAVGLLRLIWRPLCLPALAWPLHIVMDMATHGLGRFQTPFLYPFADWTLHSINWWMHGWLVAGYWTLLALLWIGILVWRRSRRGHPPTAVA